VTLEYAPERMIVDLASFNWGLEKCIEDGSLTIIDASRKRMGADGHEYSMPDLLHEIYDAVKKTNARRVVIDSISALNFLPQGKISMRSIVHEIYFGKLDEGKKKELSSINPLGEQLALPEKMRLMIYLLNRLLSDMLEVTSLVITEIEKEDKYGEKFVFDGVIEFDRVLEGLRFHRTLRIPKMRGTKTTDAIYEFTVTDNGIVVFQLSI
jgi:KaiC/GvpD/RAD55 family RecA-like ATPase